MPSPRKEELSLMGLPGELRNHIYAFAVCSDEKIVVRSPSCASPHLARVSSQVRKEVVPVFYEVNTFSVKNAHRIQEWLPLQSQETLDMINRMHFDLDSSISHSCTLKNYDLQPTQIVTDDVEDDETGEKWVEIVVVWASKEKIIESLKVEPRMGAFLSTRHLMELWEQEKKSAMERAKKRVAKKMEEQAG